MNQITPKRVISSKSYPSGNVPSWDFDAAREFNENPTFNPRTKPYAFIDKIKTNTRNHGWHFEYDGEYYLAMQHRTFGSSECISIYKTDKKQNFNTNMNALRSYLTYVDVETVVDKFFAEELGIVIDGSEKYHLEEPKVRVKKTKVVEDEESDTETYLEEPEVLEESESSENEELY